MRTWLTVDSPVGPLTLVASAQGLSHVYFRTEEPDLSEATKVTHAMDSERVHDDQSEDTALTVLSDASRQLAEYFAGSRKSFELLVDVPTPPLTFRSRAQHALRSIPYGTHWTYAQLAQAAGSEGAVRAAGSACATNPLPIVVPCHRVVRADGDIGAYRGGPDIKRFLLELEERFIREHTGGNP
ncbi:methylated-DNA--[protein]-cysteine S-methyltransferase [Corynebacterium minutissimum]|uniref:methylated-DNA--[protein]-cysteine S-methyltransferase n=1 Tax=Corynebacterium minutissimum TaxID=38301 RepID=UPI001EF21FA3|nr:methylated-DNA--[protein]-cysteine S-methyltransferase [Corynebacterium minutissimum]MCG7229321.1 methylated-DNA--[protein]-cysteine S-methyltransferase [Corynebacterium minutissimum]MCG7238311.1 methylated-DNA--[protein]-cysteine S-methyltransferase [Corynebacterium minutissimum]